ncbi:hypothetical protein NPIL_517511 [Nephila pilipes]|uniref:Uncharacterized protein n=1 Tax=Nephila pilipes TaxID=299642 RepID=A0A8X6R1Q0_NEPPI|nr:hypothetical protein NPIL_517511 [Nephila pilipes]
MMQETILNIEETLNYETEGDDLKNRQDKCYFWCFQIRQFFVYRLPYSKCKIQQIIGIGILIFLFIMASLFVGLCMHEPEESILLIIIIVIIASVSIPTTLYLIISEIERQ